MSTPPPMPMTYLGAGTWQVLPRFVAACDEHYGAGEIVRWAPVFERSRASHNHLFAEVGTVFDNLSDEQRLLWPTEDALRKHALCKAGICDVATHIAPSRAEAAKLAAFLRAQRFGDLITHSGQVVTVLTARSMRYDAMDRAAFQEAKDKVLAYLADLIGVDTATLQRAAADRGGVSASPRRERAA